MRKKGWKAVGIAALTVFCSLPLAGIPLTAKADDTGYTVEFTGTAQTPSVNLYDTDGSLIPAAEYKATFSDNINSGTATVTIEDALTGGTPGPQSSGNYDIKTTVATFTITPASAKPTVSLSTPIFMYDKNPHKPDVTVRVNGIIVPSGEYQISYLRDGAVTDDFVSGGTISVLVSDADGGNYQIQDTTADYVINNPVESFGTFEYDNDGDGKITEAGGDISIRAEDFNTTIAAANAAAQAADSASKTATVTFDQNGLFVTTQEPGQVVWAGTLSSVPSMYTGSGHYKLVKGTASVGDAGSGGYGDTASGFTIFFDGTTFSIFAGGAKQDTGAPTDACYIYRVN